CLQESCSDLIEVTSQVPPLLPYEELHSEWSESESRLVIVDLLECLVPDKQRKGAHSRGRPTLAARLPVELRQCLQTLAASPNTTVIITSDQDRKVLEGVVRDLPVFLAPEGCCVFRRPGEQEWQQIVEGHDVDSREEWMDGVTAVFNYFKERTPGSYIEKQEYQYRWSWTNAQFDFGSAQAREVLIHLWAGPLVNSEAEVVVGDRSITVRPHACSRAECLEKLLRQELGEEKLQKVDFALCFAVVSHRDEDVFEMVNTVLEEMQPPHSEAEPSPSRSRLGSGEVSACSTPRESSKRTGENDGSRSERKDSLLSTPNGPSPQADPDEPPPPYDWVPTAQREREQRQAAAGDDADVEEAPPKWQLEVISSAASDERSYFSCYTMSLGMKKTKVDEMVSVSAQTCIRFQKGGHCDWKSQCQYSHCLSWPRRPLNRHTYSPELCKHVRVTMLNGEAQVEIHCARDKECSKAHSKEEVLYHPHLFKTMLCKELASGPAVLVLGGSTFMGRETVQALLALPARVCVVNRGRKYWGTEDPSGGRVARVIADRRKPDEFASRLSAATECLADGERWALVADFCAFNGADINTALAGFKGRFKAYAYISSDSVYEVSTCLNFHLT
ncbi:unnamed protein product, partial [Polarella glacialis]